MSDKKMPAPVLYGQIHEQYGVQSVRFHPGYLDSTGGMYTIQWNKFHEMDGVPRPELAGFAISAYIGQVGDSLSVESESGIWGMTTSYSEVFRIEDAAYAKGIARTLMKVQTGLEKLSSEVGYLTDSDFSGYVLRVAKILGIKSIYVSPLNAKTWNTTGERYREVSGSGLQLWVGDIDSMARQGKRRELLHH